VVGVARHLGARDGALPTLESVGAAFEEPSGGGTALVEQLGGGASHAMLDGKARALLTRKRRHPSIRLGPQALFLVQREQLDARSEECGRIRVVRLDEGPV
jgi:hypothetical protein